MSLSSYWPREPWAVHLGDAANEGRTFVKSEDNGIYKRWVAETSHAIDPYGKRCDEATARRIAAAVNACAGIPTEALEVVASRSPNDPGARLRLLATIARESSQ